MSHMTFQLQVSLDNADYADRYGNGELAALAAELLDEAAQGVRFGRMTDSVRDVNGNRVGLWSLTAVID